MKKVLIAHPMQWFEPITRRVLERNPGVFLTPNFEQVYAMVKGGEVDRICIMYSTLTEVAPEAVKKIHQVDPNIPIMVWNSEEPETRLANEFYMDTSDFDTIEKFYGAVDEFFQKDQVSVL